MLMIYTTYSLPYKNFVYSIGMEHNKDVSTLTMSMNSRTNFGFQMVRFQNEKKPSKILEFYTFKKNSQLFSFNSRKVENSKFVTIEPLVNWVYNEQYYRYRFKMNIINEFNTKNSTLFITLGANYNSQI